MSPYPLATVLALRSREVDAARASLARALGALERRRADLLRHDAAVAAHAEHAEHAARAATDAVAAGQGPSPGALAARARWAGRLRAELAALVAARAAAARAAAAAERQAGALRDGLAAARAAQRALELHREAWRAAEARRRDRREQDAADDLVSARRAAP
ncbi:MAG TPA: hypothetical protein VFL83_10850 [Anaeromyxobacter sp.]|nr:hypothetical protein [Anaeromyxobacter sp.]